MYEGISHIARRSHKYGRLRRIFMNKVYRAAWIAAAFLGGLTVICSVWAALRFTGKKYIEV